MTFGQQPQNNGQYNPQYNTSDYNTAQQNYQYAAQDTGAGAAAINTTMTYNYEEARRASVTKVYGEMTIGVIVTAIVAFIGQMTGAASSRFVWFRWVLPWCSALASPK